jgi:hypothetical protein
VDWRNRVSKINCLHQDAMVYSQLSKDEGEMILYLQQTGQVQREW